MYGYVRIYVDVDSDEKPIPGKHGHYDLQIGKKNYTFDGIGFEYPVFSYGPDLNGNGCLLVFNRDDVEYVYPDVKQRLMTDDFNIDDTDVDNFVGKLVKTIDLSQRLYLSDLRAYAYPVTNSDFKKYDLGNANCFMAVAQWAKWLGYNKPMEILEDAQGDSREYYAYNTYMDYKDYWTDRGLIGF